ncbi:MAG: hypothetical protein H7Z41_15410 [Cytophagales bacterium]|nr:hypothetical protein [Armatimonadota bacterium]
MRKDKGTENNSVIESENTTAFDAETIADDEEIAFGGAVSAPGSVSASDRSTTEQVKETARQALSKGQEVAGQAIDKGQEVAGQAIDKAKDTVKSQLSSQKEKAVSTLGNFTDALHQTGSQLRNSGQGVFGDYADSLAGQMDRAVTYLRDNDVDDLTAQVEDFARKQPALFIGGAFILGVALARFLKSSSGSNGHRNEVSGGGYSSYSGYSAGAYGAGATPLPTPASAGALTTTSAPYGDSFEGTDRRNQFSDDALPGTPPITAHGYVAGIGTAESGSQTDR